MERENIFTKVAEKLRRKNLEYGEVNQTAQE